MKGSLPRHDPACHDEGMRFVVRVAVNAFALWIVTLLPALQVRLIPFAPASGCRCC